MLYFLLFTWAIYAFIQFALVYIALFLLIYNRKLFVTTEEYFIFSICVTNIFPKIILLFFEYLEIL